MAGVWDEPMLISCLTWHDRSCHLGSWIHGRPSSWVSRRAWIYCHSSAHFLPGLPARSLPGFKVPLNSCPYILVDKSRKRSSVSKDSVTKNECFLAPISSFLKKGMDTDFSFQHWPSQLHFWNLWHSQPFSQQISPDRSSTFQAFKILTYKTESQRKNLCWIHFVRIKRRGREISESNIH